MEGIIMKPIYLVGFMGAGKTTIGKLLSDYLNISFFDTDQVIEKKVRLSIPEIFQKYGEQFFRKLEKEVVESLPSQNVIVSTGGGMMANDEIRNYLLQKGIVIFLQCEFDSLYERIRYDKTRPLVNNRSKDELHALYQKRLSFYQLATHTIQTTHLTEKETVDKILKVLNFS